MEKEQRSIVTAIGLSILVLIGFNFFFKKTKPEPTAVTPVTQVVSEIAQPQLSREEALQLVARVPFETENYKGSIDLKKGCLDDLSLKTYKQTLAADSESVTLLTPIDAPHAEIVEMAPQDIDTSRNLPMNFELVSSDAGKIILKSTSESYDIERTFEFRPNFCVRVQDKVTNKANILKKLRGYTGILKLGTPEVSNTRVLHEGVVGVLNNSLEEIDYKKLDKKSMIVKRSSDGWLGFTDKYFMTSIFLRSKSMVLSEKTENGYAVRTYSSSKIVQPGQTISFFYDVFSGPKELKLLEKIESYEKVNRFHMAVDFGWFYFLTKPLFKLLAWFNEIFHSFGLALVVVTVLIKLALFPLAVKSYRSMKGMRLIQQRVEQIKAQYPDDKMRQQQEIIRLYQQERVQPTAGCLPILVQIPILYALYKVLYVTIEMRHAPFWGWVQDLSMPDTFYLVNGFGFFDFSVPAMLQIGLWPIFMGITMFIQQRMTPSSDPAQERAMLLLPFMFTFLFSGFPAGLVIYWTISNVLSIAQQWFIARVSD